MPILNQVKQMRQQGFSEGEITQNLKEQGLRDLEISQAIEQARIKAAISPEEQLMQSQTEEYSKEPLPISEEMQPSITESQPQEYQEEQVPIPGAEEYQEEQTPEYIYPAPQAYSPEYQAYQQYQPEIAAETTTEIAEQIVDEKIHKLKKEIGNIEELKITTERRLKNLGDRLKRIEEIIDKLQATIIGKIGNYGENLQDIEKEMTMMQESFSKTLPSLVKKQTSYPPSIPKPTKIKKKTSKKAGIEHYLKR